MIEFNKACVVGAGAIGGWLADGLARQGCQVSMLARGATLAALQRDGLRVLKKQANDSEKTEQTVESRQAVEAFNDVNVVGVQDVVVLALKAPALRAVLPSLRPLLGPNTVVLTAMNGVPWWFTHGLGGPLDGATLASVDPGGELARAVPAHHVLGCVVHASCSVEAPGVVRHHFGNGLILGEPTGGTSERVEALAALLVRAGFAATVSPRIQKDIWFKLWGNMTVNPVSALTGATTDLILGDPLVRDFVSAVMLEAKAIGERIGLPIDQQPTDRHAVTLKLGAFKTSMLQDVEAGKPVELDALVAAVREMGHWWPCPRPFTDALLGLARLQAQVKGLI
jgi:2-dehydropantoate 2-reductase